MYNSKCKDCKFHETYIYPGIVSKSQKGKAYHDEKLFFHDKYVPDYMGKIYDLMLIKLSEKLDFSADPVTHYRPMNSICLVQGNTFNPFNEYAIMTGFGTVSPTRGVDRLQVGWTLIREIRFNDDDGDGWTIVVDQYRGNGSIPCSGDSGGPLFQYLNGRAVLIGIYRSVTGCETKETSYYVRVSRHIDWIVKTITNN
ncbi:unnamed protein product [Oppiella nova]|uniref:Peptidase S1 domain-containing protein n=1 Tax=Oppiella nova TaxID=334625 RepID=A0A7R9QLF8_9ACAR|nr:unnamed protein product [Oppiella nova]CAG2167361.1 unnamed protein product [Oppiella nova]